MQAVCKKCGSPAEVKIVKQNDPGETRVFIVVTRCEECDSSTYRNYYDLASAKEFANFIGMEADVFGDEECPVTEDGEYVRNYKVDLDGKPIIPKKWTYENGKITNIDGKKDKSKYSPPPLPPEPLIDLVPEEPDPSFVRRLIDKLRPKDKPQNRLGESANWYRLAQAMRYPIGTNVRFLRRDNGREETGTVIGYQETNPGTIHAETLYRVRFETENHFDDELLQEDQIYFNRAAEPAPHFEPGDVVIDRIGLAPGIIGRMGTVVQPRGVAHYDVSWFGSNQLQPPETMQVYHLRSGIQSVRCPVHGLYNRGNVNRACPVCSQIEESDPPATPTSETQSNDIEDRWNCGVCGATLDRQAEPGTDPICANCQAGQPNLPDGWSLAWQHDDNLTHNRRVLTFRDPENPFDEDPSFTERVAEGSAAQELLAWRREANRVLAGDLNSSNYRISHEGAFYEIVQLATHESGNQDETVGQGATWREALDQAIFSVTNKRPEPKTKDVSVGDEALPLPAEYEIEILTEGNGNVKMEVGLILRRKAATGKITLWRTQPADRTNMGMAVLLAWKTKLQYENPTDKPDIIRLQDGTWVIGAASNLTGAMGSKIIAGDLSQVYTGRDPLEAYERYAGLPPKTHAKYLRNTATTAGAQVTPEDEAGNKYEIYQVRLVDGRTMPLFLNTSMFKHDSGHLLVQFNSGSETEFSPSTMSAIISVPVRIMSVKEAYDTMGQSDAVKSERVSLRRRNVEKLIEMPMYQSQLAAWCTKIGVPPVGQKGRLRKPDQEEVEMQALLKQLRPRKQTDRSRLSQVTPNWYRVSQTEAVAPAIPGQRWIILSDTFTDGWAPVESTTDPATGKACPMTYATEEEAQAEIDDMNAEWQRQIDAGERDPEDTNEDQDAVVPYDPAIHDAQWRKATGQP